MRNSLKVEHGHAPHVHVVQVPDYFGDLWLGALHQRHKCPVAAISE